MDRRALLRAAGAALMVAGTGCRRMRGAAGTQPPSDSTRSTLVSGVVEHSGAIEHAGRADAASAPDPFARLDGFCDGIAPPDGAERAGHRERLQRALYDGGHDALVIEPGATLQYLSGVRWGLSERPFLMVLPRRGEPVWVVPAFEERTAREQTGDTAIVVWQEHQSPYAQLAAILTERGLARRPVAVEPQMRHFVVQGLREVLGAGRVVDGAAWVQAQRMRKQPAELARLRRANEATKAALRQVAAHAVRLGMRQSTLAQQVRLAQQRAGLTDVWALVLFGPNAAFPHGTADDRTLAEGDLVLVDTGGSLHGYRSDITRTWAPSSVSADVRRAWSVVAQAQRAALEQIRPGVPCGAIDAAARAVIEQAGFGADYQRFTHRLGHGIGLEVHEHPYLVKDAVRVLEPGMTMSNEPGIYVPDRFGVRIEDIVAVTDDGHEIFGPLVEGLESAV
ncbi:MAG: Xaa-Pro peptidase family protein [Myxococcota bacterium]